MRHKPRKNTYRQGQRREEVLSGRRPGQRSWVDSERAMRKPLEQYQWSLRRTQCGWVCVQRRLVITRKLSKGNPKTVIAGEGKYHTRRKGMSSLQRSCVSNLTRETVQMWESWVCLSFLLLWQKARTKSNLGTGGFILAYRSQGMESVMGRKQRPHCVCTWEAERGLEMAP